MLSLLVCRSGVFFLFFFITRILAERGLELQQTRACKHRNCMSGTVLVLGRTSSKSFNSLFLRTFVGHLCARRTYSRPGSIRRPRSPAPSRPWARRLRRTRTSPMGRCRRNPQDSSVCRPGSTRRSVADSSRSECR